MMFSIIIPAHNAEKHIYRALDSIRSQDFDQYEIIVVCDACTDRTEEIAKSYGARTAAVNYHRDGLTRNKGLDMAQGRIIVFMDDDDWFLHEYALTMIHNYFLLYDVDIVAFGFIWKGKGVAFPTHDHGVYWPAVWNKAYKREFIGDTRFSDEWSVSDLGFTKALFAKEPSILKCDIPLYYYNYMRPGSISDLDRGKHGEGEM